MKTFRRKRRPGNRKPTKAEGERIEQAKTRACIPCYVWAALGNMPIEDVAELCDYNHTKSGNIRRGHKKGFAACLWHHKGHLECDGWTHQAMRAHFGPSLADGSALFHDTYGSDDDLILIQTRLLEARAEAIAA